MEPRFPHLYKFCHPQHRDLTISKKVVAYCNYNSLRVSGRKILDWIRLVCMDFAETIEFSQKFPTVHPKIFKGFNEWGIWDTETEGYIVLTDTASDSQLCFNQLEDYVKCHNLRIDQLKDYLMIATLV